MIGGLGIPYQGSKRKLAPTIVKFITKRQPHAEHFYDLFGGGGAVSFIALQTPQFKTVTYNEISPAISALLRRMIDEQAHPDHYPHELGEKLSDDFYNSITKKEFKQYITQSDWLGGLAQSVWSFGNNQKNYLYSDENKLLVEHWLVFRDDESRHKAQEYFGIALPDFIVKPDSVYGRRMRFSRWIKANNIDREQAKLRQLELLQRMARLIVIERLQRLSQLQQLQLNYKDFDPLSIPKNSVVYLDPPYEDTAGYASGSFNHEEFYEWVKLFEVPVYISSYQAREWLKPVLVLKHRETLAGSRAASGEVKEILFWNGV